MRTGLGSRQAISSSKPTLPGIQNRPGKGRCYPARPMTMRVAVLFVEFIIRPTWSQQIRGVRDDRNHEFKQELDTARARCAERMVFSQRV
jgi:hypothetical protein